MHDTVRLLLTMKEIKLAEKLRSEYKVPDRRFWWLRLTTLAERQEWSEIEKFSKLKSPVGYEVSHSFTIQTRKKQRVNEQKNNLT